MKEDPLVRRMLSMSRTRAANNSSGVRHFGRRLVIQLDEYFGGECGNLIHKIHARFLALNLSSSSRDFISSIDRVSATVHCTAAAHGPLNKRLTETSGRPMRKRSVPHAGGVLLKNPSPFSANKITAAGAALFAIEQGSFRATHSSAPQQLEESQLGDTDCGGQPSGGTGSVFGRREREKKHKGRRRYVSSSSGKSWRGAPYVFIV